jgi:hypothetical protein
MFQQLGKEHAMRRIAVAAATVLVGLALAVPAMAAKPTTTTSTTTTTAPPVPQLGVPHVVQQWEPNDGQATVRCPAGEVALSSAWMWTREDATPTWAISEATMGVVPVVENGRPVGYDFWLNPGAFGGAYYYVTCAPVNQ